MLAVEKTHHINARITGEGSYAIETALKKIYPNIVIMKDENDLIDSDESDWFNRIEITPSEILSMRRENKGITQKELSEKTGIAVSNLSLMESGKRAIGARTAKKLAEALGCDAGDFI